MSTKIQYGIFGNGMVERDDEGFILLPVIVQESGMFVGCAPEELRIRSISIIPYHNEDDFCKQWTALLNRKTDLPFYVSHAKVKIVDPLVKYTDEDLQAHGLVPLKDTPRELDDANNQIEYLEQEIAHLKKLLRDKE